MTGGADYRVLSDQFNCSPSCPSCEVDGSEVQLLWSGSPEVEPQQSEHGTFEKIWLFLNKTGLKQCCDLLNLCALSPEEDVGLFVLVQFHLRFTLPACFWLTSLPTV